MRMIIGMNFDDVLFNRRVDTPLAHLHYTRCADADGRQEVDSQHAEVAQRDYEEALCRFAQWCNSREHHDSAPIAGSQEAVAELAVENDLHIITTRPRRVEVPTRRWLKRYFPEQFRGLCFVGNSNRSAASVVKVCRDIDVSLFIEDSPERALYLAQSGVRVLLFDRLRDREIFSRNITSFSSWEEVRDFVLSPMAPAGL